MATRDEPPVPPPTDAPGGKTSVGMDATLASMRCYLTMLWCGLGIIISLVFFIIEKTNRLLRFHAMQALLFGGVWIVVGIAFKILTTVVDIAVGDTVGFMAFWGLLLVRVFVPLLLLLFFILPPIKPYSAPSSTLPLIANT